MNIEESNATIAEQKRRANILSNAIIDFEHVKANVQQVMYNTNDVTPEFKEKCRLAISICENMEKSLKDLKMIIPHSND